MLVYGLNIIILKTMSEKHESLNTTEDIIADWYYFSLIGRSRYYIYVHVPSRSKKKTETVCRTYDTQSK